MFRGSITEAATTVRTVLTGVADAIRYPPRKEEPCPICRYVTALRDEVYVLPASCPPPPEAARVAERAA